MDRGIPSTNSHQSTDYGLATQVMNNNRMGKQTASGDTVDSTLCEQNKHSLSEDSTSPTAYTKPAFSNAGMTKIQPLSTSGSQQTRPSGCSTPRYSNPTTNPVSSTAENKTNLIINYLPPNMNQEEVRALFSSVGEVESCKLVREKTSGESLGYAFVKFYDPVDAGKAIKTLNGLRLQNKTVKVSLARPSSEAIKGANLYICGLPRKMTQVELEKLFGTCGHIITARILYDTKTGLSRGVAFIRYDQRAEAEVAIRKLNGYLPPGATEQITVKFANSPSSNRLDNSNGCYSKFIERDGGAKFSMGANVSMNKLYGSMDSGSMNRSSNISISNQSPSGGSVTDAVHNGIPNNMTLSPKVPHVTGDQSTSETNCSFTGSKELSTGSLVESQSACYQGHVLTPGVPMPLPPSCTGGRPDTSIGSPIQRMNGNPRFKYHSAAVTASAMTGANFMSVRSSNGMINGQVAVNFPTGLPAFGMDFMRNLAPSAQALLAPAFAASSGALTATGWCIFVYNLAPDTEDSVLWQLFGPFGAVQTVKVIRDPPTNKCRGFGFVTMSNYEEALLAINSLNGFNLGNRVLQVSFKTTPNSRQMRYMQNGQADINPLIANMNGSTTPVPGNFTKSC